jgi:hypothetical protein
VEFLEVQGVKVVGADWVLCCTVMVNEAVKPELAVNVVLAGWACIFSHGRGKAYAASVPEPCVA